MFLIDSHCHLDQLNYKTLHSNIADVVNKARLHDVKLILAVCTTISKFYEMKSMIGCRNDVLFSCGIHPLNINEPYNFAEMYRLASDKSVIALGETGLDYYYQQNNKAQQQEVFQEHIRLGRILNKPVIVHNRCATEDIIAILCNEKVSECGGVLHCFNADCKTAKKLLDIGFYISFSGIVTFRNAEALRETVRYVPIDKLLLETDSPYLTPVPYRGKENQPAYVFNIAECIAKIKGISLINLATITTNNFCRLFHLDMQFYLNLDTKSNNKFEIK
ncbi:putative deoxyribonuclease YcfH [Candidatus Mikella endobia]|uniref:Putative deoxyribonuclease YcfH n=1 Tax=Candidatus Mikella endobia TaxID=1778264 RepID=A0A143WPM6_9ENTR|nr:YchF/TatD family DNA exonuclease [Candidatus Mikella endobia]CUX95684.1 putative deoxyribonuclease YcfH [Candidatus Mikella endobia]